MSLSGVEPHVNLKNSPRAGDEDVVPPGFKTQSRSHQLQNATLQNWGPRWPLNNKSYKSEKWNWSWTWEVFSSRRGLKTKVYICLRQFYACIRLHPVGRSINSDWLPPSIRSLFTSGGGVPHLSSRWGAYPIPGPGRGVPLPGWVPQPGEGGTPAGGRGVPQLGEGGYPSRGWGTPARGLLQLSPPE